jgi:hypothetical protein
MGTGSFPGVKRPGRGVDHLPPSSAEVEGRVELYIRSPLWAFVACSRVIFTFTSELYLKRFHTWLSNISLRFILILFLHLLTLFSKIQLL